MRPRFDVEDAKPSGGPTAPATSPPSTYWNTCHCVHLFFHLPQHQRKSQKKREEDFGSPCSHRDRRPEVSVRASAQHPITVFPSVFYWPVSLLHQDSASSITKKVKSDKKDRESYRGSGLLQREPTRSLVRALLDA